MLTKVGVRNFKNIEEATLELRQTNLLTGAGGSGKTNLIEAISILGDLARGLNADAALTAAVRGGAEAAKGPGSDFGRTTIEIGAAGRLGNPNEKADATPSTTDWELDISIDPAARRLTGERLKTCAPYAADAAGGRQGDPAAGMGYERREGAEKGMAGIARLANGWTGAFPISRSRAHTHRRHGHPLQTVPSAGLIERPQEKNRVDALR